MRSEVDSGTPPSRADRLLQVTCPYSRILSALFGILLVFSLLSLAAMLALEPTHPSHIVAQLTLILDGGLVVVLGVLLYFCRQYHARL